MTGSIKFEVSKAEFLKEAAEREEDKREFGKCQGCQGYFDKITIDDRLLCKRCAEDAPGGVPPVEQDVDDALSKMFDADDNLPF